MRGKNGKKRTRPYRVLRGRNCNQSTQPYSLAEGVADLHRAHCTLITLPCFPPLQVCLFDWRWCRNLGESLFLLRKGIQRSSWREVQTASEAKIDRHVEVSVVDANQTDETVDEEEVVELCVGYYLKRVSTLGAFSTAETKELKRTSLQNWTILSPVLINSCTSKDGFHIL